MSNKAILGRLKAAHPGWDLWDQLIALVKKTDFRVITSEYMGTFYTCGFRLSFSELPSPDIFPDWMPPFVSALYGMKADDWETAGGFADYFTGEHAKKGTLFSHAGNDEECGFPIIEIPDGVFNFQTNSYGNLFFVNLNLQVLYPNNRDECFEILDDLVDFAQANIRQILTGKKWDKAYQNMKGNLLG